MHPLVISFYTENTPYQLEALNLMHSCHALDIEIDIQGLPQQKTWALSCALKPFFIRDKLLEHRRPVFWVDADAIFLRKPDFSEMLMWDCALREDKRFAHDLRFKYYAGSLFFNYNPRAIAFVEKWCEYCEEKLKREEDPICLDQTSLADLFESDCDISIYPLPIAYAKIFDLDAQLVDPEDIVIEQHQVSRLYKNLLSS